MADLNLVDYNGIIGMPYNPVQQQYEDTCAIKSQQLILNEFGIAVTEDQLVQYSIANGWYTGNGTQPHDVGRILADAGIPCTQHENATKFDLISELSKGHKVIVGVDSGELWDNGVMEGLEDIVNGQGADHALIVAGIDNTDPDNPMVLITDPGTGDVCKSYPLDQFMDAWADSKHYMVSTDIPTPSATEQFVVNGQMDMHLPQIAGVDYPIFQDFVNYSHYVTPDMLPQLTMAFNDFPSSGFTEFNPYIVDYGMPMFDMPILPPVIDPIFDPLAFNYTSFTDTSWIDNIMSPTDTVMTDTSVHSVETLIDLKHDAMEQKQWCIDNGMPVTAALWDNEISNTQQAIDDIIGV